MGLRPIQVDENRFSSSSLVMAEERERSLSLWMC